MKKNKKITPFSENPAKWYTDVIVNSGLIAYGPTRGTVILKPLGFALWEKIREELDKEFKNLGVQNVYLPSLIPESYIQKEKKHIKGFNPELVVVSEVGGEKLAEKLVIRPTSETIFANFFKDNISSYKDLPLLFNQWVNILRWEKTTTPLLRNTEFLWQEGHTAHENEEDASKFAHKIADIYQNIFANLLAIPVYKGLKTERERFSGANWTITLETITKTGRALQSATSHLLGQNFAKAFNINFKDKENQRKLVFQTSWGFSTRSLGALILSHSDDRGLVLPPKIAPTKVDITSINPNEKKTITDFGFKLKNFLLSENISCSFDNTEKNIGFKAAKSEISGTPIRIEFGEKELKEKKIILVRRDNLEKSKIEVDKIVTTVKSILESMQGEMLQKNKKRLKEKTIFVQSKLEFRTGIKDGKFVACFFEGGIKEEEEIQVETGASARLVIDGKLRELFPEIGLCNWTKKETKRIVIFARGY